MMKLFSLTSVVLALIASAALTTAIPMPTYDDLERRSGADSVVDVDALLARHIDEATALFARDLEAAILDRRGATMSKMAAKVVPKKQDKDRKAAYPTGNPKPETPKGEFRQFTAGKKDDYFGNWQAMGGVANPAAGKGKYKKP